MTETDCTFCKMITGELYAFKVFEDKATLAFLDTYPLARGHTLIIPKVHVRKIEDLSCNEAMALFKTLYKLVSKIQNAMNTSASTVAINNGFESGQEIPHLHIHIIPRFRNNGGGPIHSIMKKRQVFTKDKMNAILNIIRDNISVDPYFTN